MKSYNQNAAILLAVLAAALYAISTPTVLRLSVWLRIGFA